LNLGLNAYTEGMSDSVLILGRQPALGLAEAESLFGAELLTALPPQAVLIRKHHSEINFSRLGGSTRLAKTLIRLPFSDWQKIADHLITNVPQHLEHFPEGKLHIGLSVIGRGPSPKVISATALSLKKSIRSSGRSVRIVPNPTPELNTAQVLHNHLTDPNGLEILVIPTGQETLLAQTVAVQDITAYAARDQKRPKRDARVGMLPPKLAQIIVNLAAGQDDAERWILDPFCGTGVVLQEALLTGYNAYGSDLEPRMVEYSRENLDWLLKQKDIHGAFRLEVGDATTHGWTPPFDVVACETYLGRPFSAPPRPEVLREVMKDVDTIHRKFLQNLARQTESGFRACIAVPAWKTQNGFQHLPVLDSLEGLGYNRLRFVHVDKRDLVYHRPDQVVARELVILQRI
jgi:SAM-dependent methyltransferase